MVDTGGSRWCWQILLSFCEAGSLWKKVEDCLLRRHFRGSRTGVKKAVRMTALQCTVKMHGKSGQNALRISRGLVQGSAGTTSPQVSKSGRKGADCSSHTLFSAVLINSFSFRPRSIHPIRDASKLFQGSLHVRLRSSTGVYCTRKTGHR